MSTFHLIAVSQGALNTGTGDATVEEAGVVIAGDINMTYQSDDMTANGGGGEVVDINGGVVGSIFDSGAANSGGDQIFVSETGYIDKDYLNAIELDGGGNSITNAGSISSVDNASTIDIQGYQGIDQTIGDSITNTGTISGTEAAGSTGDSVIECTGVETATIVNSGSILGGFGAYGIDLESYGSSSSIVNSGLIVGGLYLGAAPVSITNSGVIEGPISAYGTGDFLNTGLIEGTATFTSADATLTNKGAIHGDVVFDDNYANVYNGTLGSIVGTVVAGSGQNWLYGGADADTFDLSVGGGADVAKGGGGDDTFLLGAAFTSQDQIDGGVGYNTVVLDGDYAGGVVLRPGMATNIQDIRLTAGFNYVLTPGGALVAAGQTLTIDGSALGVGDEMTIIASAPTSGAYDLVGGDGADTFTFAASGLSSKDIVRGGDGSSVDTLKFSSAGTILATSLANVSGIEEITLANGTNDLRLDGALVGSANASLLTVVGGSGADTIDASRVTTASDHVDFVGGSGADTLIAGGGADTFVYAAANQSTGAQYDTVEHANFAHDDFDVPGGPGTIKAIKPEIKTGALSSASFNANLAAAIGASQLGAHDAVVFKASAGTLAGQTFLLVDLNGKSGYQANADLVIHLTGAIGTLAASNFV